MRKKSLLILILIIALFGCKQEPPVTPKGEFNFQIIPVINNQAFVKNETYLNPNNRAYEFENLAFYISNIYLIKAIRLIIQLPIGLFSNELCKSSLPTYK